MLLYVDDLRPAPAGWELARTVTEAVRILATRDVAVVSLDHDISLDVEITLTGEGQTTVRVFSPETFEPVARYVALMPADRRPLVRYHTANPAGEATMRAILAEVAE